MRQVSERAGVNKDDTSAVIKELFVVVGDTLRRGTNVYLNDFGEFMIRWRTARMRHNIITREVKMLPPLPYIYFRPARAFSKRFRNSILERESLPQEEGNDAVRP